MVTVPVPIYTLLDRYSRVVLGDKLDDEGAVAVGNLISPNHEMWGRQVDQWVVGKLGRLAWEGLSEVV